VFFFHVPSVIALPYIAVLVALTGVTRSPFTPTVLMLLAAIAGAVEEAGSVTDAEWFAPAPVTESPLALSVEQITKSAARGVTWILCPWLARFPPPAGIWLSVLAAHARAALRLPVLPGHGHLPLARPARADPAALEMADRVLPADRIRGTVQLVRSRQAACELAIPVDVVGIDHVALGSDYDGASMPEELYDAAQTPKLIQALRDCGYDEDSIQKFGRDNWLRVFQHVWE
jgi:hypothetical protein